jgi:transitional endoplasmic reticulum ATPase
LPLTEDVNLGELADATGGWTGADLELICKKAAILALEEHRTRPSESFRVNARHLADARAQVKTMK